MKANKQAGFTIIELLIATVVFSLVLLLISNGVIQSGRLFHKGVTISNTQEVARVIIDDVSQAIQFSVGSVIFPNPPPLPGNPEWFCIGNRRYSFLLSKQLTDGTPGADQAKHVLVVDQVDGCNSSTGPQPLPDILPDTDPNSGEEERELMGLNMRLAKFEVVCAEASPNCPSGLFNITVRVIYGDGDLLESTLDKCRGGPGSQFCSASELTTTVQKRKQ